MPVESLFATLFPGDCKICGELLVNISRLPVCNACLQDFKDFAGAQCAICGELLLSANFRGEAQGENLCGLCQRFRPSYVRAVSFGPYEGVLREMIHLLKYQKVRSAAKVLGSKLAIAVQSIASEAGEDPIVVPVPLHRNKFRERSFNQTVIVAAYAVKALSRTMPLRFEPAVMRRKRATVSQTGLTRHQRRENVRGAFMVDPAYRRIIAGKNIILVDDVFTTGTTAEECARVLRRAGAAQVWIATIARVSKLETISILARQHSHGMEERALAATGNVANG